jgi:hypothetical protein
MVIDMLEAVKEMLNDSKETKVNCAEIMLGKIIEGMKRTSYRIEELEVKIPPPTPQGKVRPPKSDQYAIVPNDDGSIREILDPSGAPAKEGMIELDGKEYTFQEAIGKKFQSGRIL